MGLSVSQVRLLALTSRKADVELQMQINAKRKQMLTRQSTELAQQYYQRLQNSSIKYATSSGYEDVNYGYLMGYTTNGHITDEFYEQLLTGKDNNLAIKTENNMILTNQFGEVVVDKDLARYIAKGKSTTGDNSSILQQTAHAIMAMVESHEGGSQQQLAALAREFKNIGSPTVVIDIIKAMIQNGGYKSGGTLYKSETGGDVYYKTAAIAAMADSDPSVIADSDKVVPQEGYCYDIRDTKSGSLDVSKMYINGNFVSAMTSQYAKYLGALASYFAPIISAGLQNGISCKYETSEALAGNEINVTEGQSWASPLVDGRNCAGAMYTGTGLVYDGYSHGYCSKALLTPGNANTQGKFDENGGDIVSKAINYFSNNTTNTYVCIKDEANHREYYFKRGNDVTRGTGSEAKTYMTIVETSEYDFKKNAGVTLYENKSYDVAQDTAKLQAGFQSGAYQLAFVDDVNRGTLKRNTMLNYFTHMNYVVEKTDSAKREEITAWFNAEQALISEKETYWDTEIQNLSTELTSVNAEIESVKSLKSNAIKSVFDWGNS